VDSKFFFDELLESLRKDRADRDFKLTEEVKTKKLQMNNKFKHSQTWKLDK